MDYSSIYYIVFYPLEHSYLHGIPCFVYYYLLSDLFNSFAYFDYHHSQKFKFIRFFAIVIASLFRLVSFSFLFIILITWFVLSSLFDHRKYYFLVITPNLFSFDCILFTTDFISLSYSISAYFILNKPYVSYLYFLSDVAVILFFLVERSSNNFYLFITIFFC